MSESKAVLAEAWKMAEELSGMFLQVYDISLEDIGQFSESRGLGKRYGIFGSDRLGFLTAALHPALYTQCRGKVHDNGTGIGNNARLFSRLRDRVEHVTASDIDPELIELGYELFRDRDTCTVDFAAVDSCALCDHYGEGVFDTVYDGLLLHALPDVDHIYGALEQARRSLRRNGVHFGIAQGTLKQKTERDEYEVHERIHLSQGELQTALEAMGYEDVYVMSGPPTDGTFTWLYYFGKVPDKRD